LLAANNTINLGTDEGSVVTVSVGRTVILGVNVSCGKITDIDVSVGKNACVLVVNAVADKVEIVAGGVGGMRELSQLISG
jgi:hypothetical protein